MDELKSDINSLADKIFQLKQQLHDGRRPEHVLQAGLLAQVPPAESPPDEQFFVHMAAFLAASETQVKQLTRKVETDLEQIRAQLGE